MVTQRWNVGWRGAVAAGIVSVAAVWAAVALMRARNASLSRTIRDELIAENQALVREREHSTRGRVFIEMPVVQGGNPMLDSLAGTLLRQLTDVVSRSHAAHVVPRDSVVAIQSAAMSEGGWNSPRRTLGRANAPIGVMTVLWMRNDSVRVSATFERLVPTTPEGEGALETSPLLAFSESMRGRPLIPLRLAAAIIGALDQMRSCDADKHMAERSVPWCWRRENEPGIVKDYFRARRERAAQLRADASESSLAP